MSYPSDQYCRPVSMRPTVLPSLAYRLSNYYNIPWRHFHICQRICQFLTVMARTKQTAQSTGGKHRKQLATKAGKLPFQRFVREVARTIPVSA